MWLKWIKYSAILMTVNMMLVGCSNTTDSKSEISQNTMSEQLSSQISENKVHKIIEQYVCANTWEERLDYIKDPEKMKPLMEEYYTDYSGPESKPTITFGEIYEISENVIEVYTTIEEEINGNIDTRNQLFFLFKNGNDYKIDWQSSTMHNPISWTEFKAVKPTEEVEFRAAITLGDYYNYEFADKHDEYWSINLLEIDDDMYSTSNNLFINGFIKKDSEDGEKLFELLKNGDERWVVLNIRYIEGGSQQSNCVEITDVVSTIPVKENN